MQDRLSPVVLFLTFNKSLTHGDLLDAALPKDHTANQYKLNTSLVLTRGLKMKRQ